MHSACMSAEQWKEWWGAGRDLKRHVLGKLRVALQQLEAQQVLLGLLVVLHGVLQAGLRSLPCQPPCLLLTALSGPHKVVAPQACAHCHSVVAQLLVQSSRIQAMHQH